MAALLGPVLFIYFTYISTVQTTDCLHLREQCINAGNGCESVWNVVEDACNISGNRCKAEDTVGCNRIIQVLADKYPEFKNCVCTTDNICSITTLLGKRCGITKDHLEPSSRPDTARSTLALGKAGAHGRSAEPDTECGAERRRCRAEPDTECRAERRRCRAEPDRDCGAERRRCRAEPDRDCGAERRRCRAEPDRDCGAERRRCRAEPLCAAALRSFQRACGAPAGSCGPAARGRCSAAWAALRGAGLGRCGCSEPRQRRCLQVWKGIFNNPCVPFSHESQASGARENDGRDDGYNADSDGEKTLVTDTDNISMETKLQWGLSALPKQAYTTNRSCLDVNRECVEDEVCNKQLSLYLKVCSVNKKCNVEGCQAAIRLFYRNMPLEVAQMMIFCDCTQHDESCHRAKELLHGKPCVVVPPPSCLDVIHMCEENELCRKKYTTFRSKCWRHVTEKCYNDAACLETLIKDEVPCSASAGCKAAYISSWGTVLHMECTCQNLPPLEQPLCELFHHMLHSKSCFSDLRQISIQKKGFHRVNTEMPGEEISGAQLHSSAVNGETVYIVAYSSCIALILGIVLLTLLKIRACRTKYESRSPLPDHSSETFMAHYKSHR